MQVIGSNMSTMYVIACVQSIVNGIMEESDKEVQKGNF